MAVRQHYHKCDPMYRVDHRTLIFTRRRKAHHMLDTYTAAKCLLSMGDSVVADCVTYRRLFRAKIEGFNQ